MPEASQPQRKRACDACHQRKIFCDASDLATGEPCDWCHHQSLSCTFDRNKSLHRPANIIFDHRLPHGNKIRPAFATFRKKRLPSPKCSIFQSPSRTGQILGAQIDLASVHQPQASSLENALFGRLSLVQRNFESLISDSGSPYFAQQYQQRICQKTGRYQSVEPHFAVAYLMPGGPASFADVPSTDTGKSEATSLPAEAVFNCILCELSSKSGHCVYIVDSSQSRKAARLVYHPREEHHMTMKYAQAKAHVLAVLALGGYLLPDSFAATYIDKCHLSDEAHYILSENSAAADLSTLQIVLMLLYVQLLRGHLKRAILYHKVARDIIFALGGHLIAATRPSRYHESSQERQDCRLRSLVWACFSLEKDLSLQTGQQLAIGEESCFAWPVPTAITARVPTHRDRLDHLANTAQLSDASRLTLLKGKILSRLYSAESFDKSAADVLNDIRELDDELENWRLSMSARLPLDLYAWRGVNRSCTVEDVGDSDNVELILDYYFLLQAIHCASSRKVMGRNMSDADIWYGVTSSLNLCLQACRSALTCLITVAGRLPADSVWRLQSHAASAIVGVFFNVLEGSFDDTKQDMDLLNELIALLRTIRVQNAYQATCLRQMQAFIQDLAQLASAAIAIKIRDAHKS